MCALRRVNTVVAACSFLAVYVRYNRRTVLNFVVQLSEYLVTQQERPVLLEVIVFSLAMNSLFRLGLLLTRTVYRHAVVHSR